MIKGREVTLIKKVTKTTILERVSQEALFNFYLKRDPNSTKKQWTNPLRKDKKPGCYFNVSKRGVIYFNDTATEKSYDAFAVIMEKFNISFQESLNKIIKDFKIDLTTKLPASEKQKLDKKFEIKKKKIQAIIQDFSEEELDYWYSFGITKETLERFNVKSAKYIYIDKEMAMRSTDRNPIFVYYFPNSERLKIYRPLTRGNDKWLSTTTGNDINGDDALPFLGDKLIITSSLKDVMCLYELGYIAIAPQSETTKLTATYIESLKVSFKEIYIFFDNDGEFNPPKERSGKGKDAAVKAGERYKLEYRFIPDGEPKDISDFYQENGKEKCKKLLKSLFK